GDARRDPRALRVDDENVAARVERFASGSGVFVPARDERAPLVELEVVLRVRFESRADRKLSRDAGGFGVEPRDDVRAEAIEEYDATGGRARRWDGHVARERRRDARGARTRARKER